MLALLALAAFEAVTPLAAAARELSATLAAGRRLLELTDARTRRARPCAPGRRLRSGRSPSRSTTCAPATRRQRRPVLEPRQPPARAGRAGRARSARAAPGRRRSSNLLLRFLDPEAGRVTIAGRDLREYRLEDVRARDRRRRPGLASLLREHPRQRPPRAPGRRRPRDRARAPARPDLGLDPRRFRTGWTRSSASRDASSPAGQRQRLVLARALLAGAPVLVLDEPTAHLDPRTAAELMRDVFAAAGDRTVLLITHRSEGLDLVDRVLTLRPALHHMRRRPTQMQRTCVRRCGTGAATGDPEIDQLMSTVTDKRHVVIVGGGFAGLGLRAATGRSR